MGIIGKLFGHHPDIPTPEWAHFFAPGGYAAFETALRKDLDSRNLPFELIADEGVVMLTGEGIESGQFGLGNLAQLCNQSPRRFWAKLIADHFDMVLQTAKSAESSLDRFENDFEAAREVLKVRLYPSDMPNRDFMVFREPADGLIAALVYDLPQSVASVHKDHAEKWGKSEDELFALGLENVKAEGLIQPSIVEVPGGATVTALTGGSFFTASHLLFLSDYLKPENELGAVACVPHRHTVMFHPIQDEMAVSAMNALIPAAFGMFQEGPGSISPYLYWYHDGKLQRQPTEITDTSIEFEPTEEFIFQVLNRIRG